jgi:hypothetical protein
VSFALAVVVLVLIFGLERFMPRAPAPLLALAVAIIASGLGSALFVFIRARAFQDPEERRFIRTLSGYFIVFFLVFGMLFYGSRLFASDWNVLVRSLIGFAYLLPPLIWLRRRYLDTGNALLTRLAGSGPALDRWLATTNLSPRERQIAACVLEGKSNKTIEQELFIGRRTVENPYAFTGR